MAVLCDVIVACAAGGIVRVPGKILAAGSEYGRRGREENNAKREPKANFRHCLPLAWGDHIPPATQANVIG